MCGEAELIETFNFKFQLSCTVPYQKLLSCLFNEECGQRSTFALFKRHIYLHKLSVSDLYFWIKSIGMRFFISYEHDNLEKLPGHSVFLVFG